MQILTVTGLKTRYRLSYEQILAGQAWTNLARKVESTQPDGETYGGAEGVKGMSERKGENIWHTVPATTFQIRNRTWDGGIRISKLSWEYNKTAEAQYKVDQCATLAASHPGRLMEDLWAAITTTTGPDGVAFAAATHPVNGTTHSNLHTSGDVSELNVATATKPTAAEWADALFGVATKVQLYIDDAGNQINLGVRDFTVLVPPGLHVSLLKALSQQFLATGESNPLKAVSKFSFSPMMLPNWSATTEFILAANGQSPMVYQELEDPGDMDVFGPGTEYYRLNTHVFGKVTGIYNVGYDRWQGCAHATLS